MLAESLETHKNTYLDYIKDAKINYDLKTAEGRLITGAYSENIDYDGIVAKIGYDESAIYEITVEEEGYYHIVVDHFIESDVLSNINLEIKINGSYSFMSHINRYSVKMER